MKVCLLTSAKDEDDHIEEFLEHYFDIVGIDHIFWIDNNSEPLKPVNINDSRVTVIDKRNINFDSGKDIPLHIMRDLINDVYQEYIVNSEYDWCCYFDPDELLEIDCNIKEYIKNLNNEYDVALFRWVLHGNNNYIWESELPSNRMKINYGYDTNYEYTRKEYKPLFKINQQFKINIYFYNTNSIIENCDTDRIKIDTDSKLHHYRIQCIETYIKHKIKNGFYGFKNREDWCKNLFFSSQFTTSNVIITREKSKEMLKLLKYYNVDKMMSKIDKLYLYSKYNVKLLT